MKHIRRSSKPSEPTTPRIVTYSDTAAPTNQFPHRIVSPTHASPCCFSAMEDLGRVRRDQRYEYVYRRCRTCGFTVRVIVHSLPDRAYVERLRKVFATMVARKLPPA